MTPTTYVDVAAFIDEFEERRLPKARWTHEGHLVAGLWYVWRFGPEQALEHLPALRVFPGKHIRRGSGEADVLPFGEK